MKITSPGIQIQHFLDVEKVNIDFFIKEDSNVKNREEVFKRIEEVHLKVRPEDFQIRVTDISVIKIKLKEN